MLEIRLNCENCNKTLHHESLEAMICSYECTFCMECVENVLHNVCPNCGGGFEKRPIRPRKELLKNPPREERVLKPIISNEYLERNRNIPPEKR